MRFMSNKFAGLIFCVVLIASQGTTFAQKISDATFSQEDIDRVTDPSRLYKLVGLYSLHDNREVEEYGKEYLKFYASGQVKTFYAWNSSDVASLDPENSDKGYFKISNGQLILRLHYKHPQGNGYMKYVLHKIEDGYMYLSVGGYIGKYEIISLHPHFILYDEQVND